MKKKQLLLGISLAALVLISILMQSLHAYSHYLELVAKPECQHKYNSNPNELTHQHHQFEDCKVCHFTFGNSISPLAFAYHLKPNFTLIPFFYQKGVFFVSFSGSLYSHRGPPLQA